MNNYDELERKNKNTLKTIYNLKKLAFFISILWRLCYEWIIEMDGRVGMTDETGKGRKEILYKAAKENRLWEPIPWFYD